VSNNPEQTRELIERYYFSFNAGDMETFFSLMTDDVIHDINQDGQEVGIPAFRAFMDKMNRCYKESLEDIEVMVNSKGHRAAAEFVVVGEYLATDEGLPAANGQTYQLPAGAFFEIRDGKVARISNYYNLQDWLVQVGGA